MIVCIAKEGIEGTLSSCILKGESTKLEHKSKMDLKGQRCCERMFLGIMWPATILSCLAGFIVDDVSAIFKVFGVSLGVSALVSCFIQPIPTRCASTFERLTFPLRLQLCMPNWPMYNRNPIQFVVESESDNASTTTEVKQD